jgi:hypothetical protein
MSMGICNQEKGYECGKSIFDRAMLGNVISRDDKTEV